ncbi:unnamed protein product [Rhodiola kirilowii]
MAIISIILSLFITFTLFISFTAAAQSVGFSTALYHRDSPSSPFYDPALSQTERVRRAIARSIARANHFRLRSSVTPNTPKADLKGDGVEYLMNISIGTPPVPIVAIADTGSDLIWTQCAPCTGCYKQTLPLFTPTKSTTFLKIPCDSSACPVSSETSCTNDNSCGYSVQYGDGSYSNGVISTETFTLKSTAGPPVKLRKYLFGCGFDNEGTFSPDGSGIIGLGGGAESLVSQLGSQIDGKFSYCLIPTGAQGDGISTINFGRNAIVSGRGTLKTPLIKSTPDTFYFLTLHGFTVGNVKIPFSSSGSGSTSSEGNIIIDSGTTFVIVTPDVYSDLEAAVSKQIDAKPVQDPSGSLTLCYKNDASFKPPSITANFDGADVKLRPYNTFVEISEGLICLAFAESSGQSIYGNLAQMNFLVGYDVAAGTLSFKPTDCTKA